MANIISVWVENAAGIASYIVLGHIFDGQPQESIRLNINQKSVRREELLVVLEPLDFRFRVSGGTGRELGNHALVDITVANLLEEYWWLRSRMLLTVK